MKSLPLPFASPPEFVPTLADYDWIVVSTSAGKDSQAMLDVVTAQARIEGVLDRVVAVHADLGRMEWKGTRELAGRQAAHYGIRFEVVSRKQGHLLERVEHLEHWPRPSTRYCTSDFKRTPITTLLTRLTSETAPRRSADLLAHVEHRGMFPSPKARYCTSDHKRAPVATLLTRLARESGRPVRILNCQGMRAQESPGRAKLEPFRRDERNSNGRRVVDVWLPIHGWTVDEVWARIRASGVPHHYAYDLGMPRLSCVFCIFAPKTALMLAGQHNRELLDEYVAVEKRIGHRFKNDLALAEIRDALERGERAEPVVDWKM